MRYMFYREHKYVSFRFNELERLIAKTDFQREDEYALVKDQFEALIELLEAHADYEDTMLHTLLQQKNSAVYEHIEQDHQALDEQVAQVRSLIEAVNSATSPKDRIEAGYQLYRGFRKFNAENLLHLHEEETIILPELQRLYSDEELQSVEAATYKIMSIAELIGMLQELFPHMNPTDWLAFLTDIKKACPEKFDAVWSGINHYMTPTQQAYIKEHLAHSPS